VGWCKDEKDLRFFCFSFQNYSVVTTDKKEQIKIPASDQANINIIK